VWSSYKTGVHGPRLAQGFWEISKGHVVFSYLSGTLTSPCSVEEEHEVRDKYLSLSTQNSIIVEPRSPGLVVEWMKERGRW
jgi:hypothetical protein